MIYEIWDLDFHKCIYYSKNEKIIIKIFDNLKKCFSIHTFKLIQKKDNIFTSIKEFFGFDEWNEIKKVNGKLDYKGNKKQVL